MGRALIYGSVCSGVEAATVAWHSLGWQPQWFSEIEKFPSAVLKHHYPAVPNHGDMTKFKEWNDGRPIDVLVGGTPCQSFSVAGLRKGLDDPRGNLMLTYLAIAARYRPRWLVWENVPGVLSSNKGRDFGTFLGALGECGYGFAYRVLDAQYFGVAQRRRRVFVVGYLGSWQRAAAVLFERHSLQGNIAPRRQEGEKVAPTVTTGAPFSSAGNESVECEAIVVRRLTPIECERLQGFPDNYTDIRPKGKPTPDGPRYKAMGNSMAVPVMRWIGERIQKVEDITQKGSV
jgi:DNA (cytosine-5)-methyltransferase 1